MTKDREFSGVIAENFDMSFIPYPQILIIQDYMREILRGHCSRHSPVSLLEIGVGTGTTTLYMLLADYRIKIIGIDNEPDMLKIAKKRLAYPISQERVKLVEADGLKYLRGIEKNSIDGFVSGATLHNFEQSYREEVLERIYYGLRSGGIFLNADKYAHNDPQVHNIQLRLQIKKIQDVYRVLGRRDLEEEWVKHYEKDNKPEFLMKESEAIQTMQRIGFKKTQMIKRIGMDALMVGYK